MNIKLSYLKFRGTKVGPVHTKNFGKIRDRDETGHRTGESEVVCTCKKTHTKNINTEISDTNWTLF